MQDVSARQSDFRWWEQFFIPMHYTQARYVRAQPLGYLAYFASLCFGTSWAARVIDRAHNLRNPGEGIWNAMLRHNGNTLQVKNLDRVPLTGPVVIVSNHPTGFVEGMILGALLDPIRPDLKFVATSQLLDFELTRGFAHRIIPVPIDARLSGAEGIKVDRASARSLRQIIKHLSEGKALVNFPPGAGWSSKVMSKDGKRLKDRPWDPSIFKVAKSQKATLVPIRVNIDTCRSRRWAHWLGSSAFVIVGPAADFRALRGQTISIEVGEPVGPDALANQNLVELSKQCRRFCNRIDSNGAAE